MFILIILYLYNYWELSRREYVITASAIEVHPKKRLINILAPVTADIPFKLIHKIKVIPPPKNLFEVFFSKLRIQKLLGEGKLLWSLSSTGILRDVVLVDTNVLKGIKKVCFVLSPEDKEKFVKTLKARIK